MILKHSFIKLQLGIRERACGHEMHIEIRMDRLPEGAQTRGPGGEDSDPSRFYSRSRRMTLKGLLAAKKMPVGALWLSPTGGT